MRESLARDMQTLSVRSLSCCPSHLSLEARLRFPWIAARAEVLRIPNSTSTPMPAYRTL